MESIFIPYDFFNAIESALKDKNVNDNRFKRVNSKELSSKQVNTEFTADQARKLTNSAINSKFGSNLDRLFNLIKEKASNGEDSLVVSIKNNKLKEFFRKHLTDLNFKVTRLENGNIMIKW